MDSFFTVVAVIIVLIGMGIRAVTTFPTSMIGTACIFLGIIIIGAVLANSNPQK